MVILSCFIFYFKCLKCGFNRAKIIGFYGFFKFQIAILKPKGTPQYKRRFRSK
jgi:hypothetical protein